MVNYVVRKPLVNKVKYSYLKRRSKLLRLFPILLCFLFVISPSHAFLDFGGNLSQLPYLVKILDENQKRYQQLQLIMKQAKMSQDYIKAVNHGMENIRGLMHSLPIRDQGVLNKLRNFNSSVKTIHRIYGRIPKSPDQNAHRLHDQTAAESLYMVNAFKDYSRSQESNAKALRGQAKQASPKGAARMTVVSNALILESINQLIRLQSQSLKIQSELLALQNKRDKTSVGSYQIVERSFKKAFQNLERPSGFMRF